MSASIFLDIINSSCLRNVTQAEFLLSNVAFIFQGIFNLRLCFMWRAIYCFRSLCFARSFHDTLIFVFWRRRYASNFNCFLFMNRKEVFPGTGIRLVRWRCNAIRGQCGSHIGSSGKLDKIGSTPTAWGPGCSTEIGTGEFDEDIRNNGEIPACSKPLIILRVLKTII